LAAAAVSSSLPIFLHVHGVSRHSSTVITVVQQQIQCQLPTAVGKMEKQPLLQQPKNPTCGQKSGGKDLLPEKLPLHLLRKIPVKIPHFHHFYGWIFLILLLLLIIPVTFCCISIASFASGSGSVMVEAKFALLLPHAVNM